MERMRKREHLKLALALFENGSEQADKESKKAIKSALKHALKHGMKKACFF